MKILSSSFIFGTQITIFLIKSESSLTLRRQQCSCNVPRSRNVVRTSVKIVHKENNNNIIYSTILLPELPSSAILESIPENNQRNQHCLHSVDSARMLNVNNADYVDYILGYAPKWQKTVTLGEELLNKLYMNKIIYIICI